MKKQVVFICSLLFVLCCFFASCDNDPANGGPKPGDVITSASGMKLAWIPAGTFTMGSPETEKGRYNDEGEIEEVQWQVTLSGFYMGIYQITQEQWAAVMEGNTNGIDKNPSVYNGESPYEPAPGEIPARRPVEMILWYETLVFANRLSVMDGFSPAYRINGSTNPDDWGEASFENQAAWDAVVIVAGSTGYRLPTEAQWEYACRAGSTTAFNDGTDDWQNETALGKIGWFRFNSTVNEYVTHEVGKKDANAWGLYDMHGNVYEFCWDWYDDAYPDTPGTNPTGPSSGDGRVTRGGSFRNEARHARSAFRTEAGLFTSYSHNGFRLVRP